MYEWRLAPLGTRPPSVPPVLPSPIQCASPARLSKQQRGTGTNEAQHSVTTHTNTPNAVHQHQHAHFPFAILSSYKAAADDDRASDHCETLIGIPHSSSLHPSVPLSSRHHRSLTDASTAVQDCLLFGIGLASVADCVVVACCCPILACVML